MSPDDLPSALRRHFDRVAPPVTPAEATERAASARLRPWRPAVAVAAVVILVVAIAAGLALARWTGHGPQGGVAEEGSTTSVPEIAPPGPAGWPELVTATPNRPEVLRVDPETGEVVGRFAPPSLQNGGLDGATGATDGRLAAWAGGRVAIEDGDVTYETELDRPPGLDAAVAHTLRVVLMPDTPAAWIRDGTASATRVWRWDYLEGDPVRAEVELPSGLFPAGVTDSGRLVLSGTDQGGPTRDGRVVVLAGRPSDPEQATFVGTALAVQGERVLLRRCVVEAAGCLLYSVDADTASATLISTGEPDPDAVRDLLGPVIPSDSAPLPVGDRGSSRVLVALDVGPRPPQDQPTVVGSIDLEVGGLLVIDGERNDSLAAATWSCDGSDVLVFGLRSYRSLSGDLAETDLPEDTFLYGVGAC